MIAMQPSSSLKQNATKYGTAILYVVVFVYGIVQGFDMAYLVRKMRGDLYIKMERLKKFVATAQRVTDARRSELDLFSATAEPVELEADMTSFYKLVTSPIMRERLGNLLKNTYIIDALCGMNKIVKRGVWSKCKYEAATTRLWGMGHPLLRRQVLNPLSLHKNIIITGPNAGGKTTYMKSICANIVLAQSIGYVCATRNEISTVHAIGTSIRVHDSVGSESLFEAEVKRCSSIALEARDISDAGKRAVYFLDEPMNSTPPIEGAATTMSIASYVGSLKGVRLFITTHYHEVTRLEEMHPSDWKNVSMEAIFDSNTGSYKFPYRIRAGPSFQCIALEILKERDLPDEIVDTAIEMKNKICEVVIDRHAS
jgi:DNA mismatch repair ATPase MutS